MFSTADYLHKSGRFGPGMNQDAQSFVFRILDLIAFGSVPFEQRYLLQQSQHCAILKSINEPYAIAIRLDFDVIGSFS